MQTVFCVTTKCYHATTFAENSNRSSHSDGSKEFVEFRYNPVYRDTDPEDVDPHADLTSTQTNAQTNVGCNGYLKVCEGDQETIFTDEAEILKNEDFELLPEVGGFSFSPRHLWARALSPDLRVKKGIELAQEWVSSMDTAVSSQDPNVEIQCNNVVLD